MAPKHARRPSILLLSFSPLGKDPRVLRQACFLKDDCEVVAAGYGPAEGLYPAFVPIEPPHASVLSKAAQATRLKLHRFEAYYWAQPHVADAWSKLRAMTPDAIVANELSSLPLAVRLARRCGASILLDAHEYEPRQFEGAFLFDFFFRALWDHVARTCLPFVAAMTTVCESIANLYAEEYGIRPEVVTNASFRNELPPSPVASDAVRIIHHGICTPFRGLENMIDLASRLDGRFGMDLMLVKTDEGSYVKIRSLAEASGRVTLRPPVPFEQIVPVLNGYDIGLCMFPPSSPNMRFILPNKLFEFIQAKLCVCTWPSPEVQRIVASAGCGPVAEDFSVEAMAAAINALGPEDIRAFKANAVRASAVHCAENNRAILLREIDSALSSPRRVR